MLDMASNEAEKTLVETHSDLNVLDTVRDDICNMIYVIRGKQVMIDSNLAMLYHVETKVFNQSVKRNANRFPDGFRFQLNQDEYDSLRSQIVTSKKKESNEVEKGGRRYMPYVFTEQGIAMLSAVLRSDVAINVSIRIMNAFVESRHFMTNNSMLFERLKTDEVKQLQYQKRTDESLEQIFEYISDHEESSQKVFFDGQIYDAFSMLTSLVEKAEKNIKLIDGYADIRTLNILAKKRTDVAVTIFTHKKTKLTGDDVDIFNAQYPLLELKYTSAFHDRFIILDNSTAYHIGASIKDAGKKCFGINLIRDKVIVKNILQRLTSC